MSELTREQVEFHSHQITGGDIHSIKDHVAMLVTHDAAQRAKIAALERELEQHVWEYSPAMAEAKINQLHAQLAETHVHLNAQRTATYQAVKREHAAGRELALLKDTEKFIKQLAEIRKARHEATASPDTP